MAVQYKDSTPCQFLDYFYQKNIHGNTIYIHYNSSEKGILQVLTILRMLGINNITCPKSWIFPPHYQFRWKKDLQRSYPHPFLPDVNWIHADSFKEQIRKNSISNFAMIVIEKYDQNEENQYSLRTFQNYFNSTHFPLLKENRRILVIDTLDYKINSNSLRPLKDFDFWDNICSYNLLFQSFKQYLHDNYGLQFPIRDSDSFLLQITAQFYLWLENKNFDSGIELLSYALESNIHPFWKWFSNLLQYNQFFLDRLSLDSQMVQALLKIMEANFSLKRKQLEHFFWEIIRFILTKGEKNLILPIRTKCIQSHPNFRLLCQKLANLDALQNHVEGILL